MSLEVFDSDADARFYRKEESTITRRMERQTQKLKGGILV